MSDGKKVCNIYPDIDLLLDLNHNIGYKTKIKIYLQYYLYEVKADTHYRCGIGFEFCFYDFY